jgi:transcriptional regulator with XRE-family HTH domain
MAPSELNSTNPSTEYTNLLRDIITRAGLTHRELCASLGLSPAILSLILQRKRHPSRDTIIVLAIECGCDGPELNQLLRCASYAPLMGNGPVSLPISEGPKLGRDLPERKL